LLLGRMRRRRLEAEAIRDNLLSVAGTLDRRPGGPADRMLTVPRRGIYQMTIRSARAGFAPLFDSADSTAPTDKRTTSTIAPQALFLLNSDFAREQTRALTRRILTEKDDKERISRAYNLLYGRPPSAAEVALATSYLKGTGAAGWGDYLQV